MRTTAQLLVAAIAAVLLVACPGPGPARCVPAGIDPAVTNEPLFPGPSRTVLLTRPALGNGCAEPADEEITFDLYSPSNRRIEGTLQPQPSTLWLTVDAPEPGAYHLALRMGTSGFFQIPIFFAVDRRDAGFVDLPAECDDVQRTKAGTFICSPRSGTSFALTDAGKLELPGAPVVSGDTVWTWEDNIARRFIDDGGCFSFADSSTCLSYATQPPVSGSFRLAATEHTLYVDTPVSLLIHRGDAGNEGPLISRHDLAWTAAVDFGARALVAGATMPLLAHRARTTSPPTLTGSYELCSVEVPGAATAAVCTALSAPPVGALRSGVFTQLRDAYTFVAINGDRAGAQATLTVVQPTSFNRFDPPEIPAGLRRSVAPLLSVGAGTYIPAITDAGVMLEVYSPSMKATAADDVHVWYADNAKTRVYFR